MTFRRSLMLPLLATALALSSGCSGELKKEIATAKAEAEALAKGKASLEVELTKKSVELDALKDRLAETKRREGELSQKLAAQQTEAEKLRAELTTTKEQFAALGKQVDTAKAKLAEMDRERRDKESKATVDFQAAVTYENGDSKPIINGEFLVLKKSMAEIFKETGLDSAPEQMASFFHFARTEQDSKVYDLIAPAVRRNLVATLKTNLNGTANVDGLPPGEYWFSGTTFVSNRTLLWDLKGTITLGKNQVYLEARNAAAVYPR